MNHRTCGECAVRGVRWLLEVGRCWGKRLSSVVVYLDHPVVVGAIRCGSDVHSILWSGRSLGVSVMVRVSVVWYCVGLCCTVVGLSLLLFPSL